MPVVNGKEFPYTKKGMEDAAQAKKAAPSGKGMSKKNPGGMTNPQQTPSDPKKAAKVDALRNAAKKASAGMSAKKAALGGMKTGDLYKKPVMPNAPATNLPAKVGESGMKSNMPAVKDAPLKKKNLGMM